MKRKLTTGLLLVAVAVIWGTIFYKVFRKDANIIRSLAGNAVGQKAGPEIQSYTLLSYYPDPFFPESKPAVTAPATGRPVEWEQAVAVWPEMKYSGFIASGKQVRAALLVNGMTLMLKVGEIFDDRFMVSDIRRDSILICKDYEKKWFKK